MLVISFVAILPRPAYFQLQGREIVLFALALQACHRAAENIVYLRFQTQGVE